MSKMSYIYIYQVVLFYENKTYVFCLKIISQNLISGNFHHYRCDPQLRSPNLISGNFHRCYPQIFLVGTSTKDMVLQVLATCCYSLQRCIFLLDGSGIILDRETAEESSEMLLLHIKAYSWLAAYFYKLRIMVFRIRPKPHYIYHQAVQLREWRINMSVFATWSDESFLGKIKLVGTACHGKTMTSRVFQRYLLCLALLVHRHNQLDESIG